MEMDQTKKKKIEEYFRQRALASIRKLVRDQPDCIRFRDLVEKICMLDKAQKRYS